MQRSRMALMLGAVLLGMASPSAHGQSSGQSIVEEALQGGEQDQARDSQRVRSIIEEAVRGAEQAPSGIETVAPSAPEVLEPMGSDSPPGLLPVGLDVSQLIGRPVEDAAGARLGTIRAVAVEQSGQTAHALVEFADAFGRQAKTAAVPLDKLTPSATTGSGYVVALTAVAYDQLPAYEWRDGAWRRQG